jgi:hypothetical protein
MYSSGNMSIYLSFNDECVIQIGFHSGFVVLANILNQEKLLRGFIGAWIVN